MIKTNDKNNAQVDDNIAKLAEVFPECVLEKRQKNGVVKRCVDFEKLCGALGLSEEYYCREKELFTWVGKKNAYEETLRPTEKTLLRMPEWEFKSKKTNNVYIEGDNLDVLKILCARKFRGVDIIYVDPPYNTGYVNFVYNDRFNSSNKRKRRLKSTNDEWNEIYSDWRSMFYSRMILAREILADTGAVFVSVDDCEQANAVKILDEVYGRQNFVATFVWETKREAKGIPPASMRVANHEYILCYSKSSAFRFNGDPRNVNDGFANPDNDPRGPWKRQYLQRFGLGFREKTIVDPGSGRTFTFETPYTQEKLERWIEEKRVIFPTSPKNYPARKEFFAEYKNPFKPVVTSWGLFSTKVGSEEVKKLFGGVKVFDYPKPLELLKTLLRRAAPKNALVMDFFAGSGTLGHAVMALNAEEGAALRFLLVQAPEPCGKRSAPYKAGFENIGAICRARLIRAAITLDKGCQDVDLGFRAYRVV